MQNMTPAATLLLFLWALGPAAANKALGQTDEEVEKMRAAMPDALQAEPEKGGRKLLVFTLCRGFVHESVPYGAKALEIMAEETEAFEAVLNDDIAMFEPENLAQFDAVCMMNTTGIWGIPSNFLELSKEEQQAALEAHARMETRGELFLPENYDELSPAEKASADAYSDKLKASLVDYVRSGKGLVGAHAATDCFYKWPEYGEMLGGFFIDHPWNEEVTIRIEEPEHPVCAAFEEDRFVVVDEIYAFGEPYSREKLRVLLSLDTERTNMDTRQPRSDMDYAVSWVRKYGEGRVFYCSLGHRPEIFWNPVVLKHYLDGIQFALGDLEADATPNAKREPGESQT